MPPNRDSLEKMWLIVSPGSVVVELGTPHRPFKVGVNVNRRGNYGAFAHWSGVTHIHGPLMLKNHTYEESAFRDLLELAQQQLELRKKCAR